jgi:hypothetical protein
MKKQNGGLTIEEIERYWGSLAAYNEEQRRCGLFELELHALDQVAYATRPSFSHKPKARGGFHLFGRH